MRRFFYKLGFFLLILIVGGIIIAREGLPLPEGSFPFHRAATPSVLPAQDLAHIKFPDITMLLVQENTEGNAKRILSCGASICKTLSQPSSATDEALYGEGGWYAYTEREGKLRNDPTLLALVRISDDGQEKTIVEETTFVKPRGLYISPDGQKVAYFLDNKEKSELTEIWVYEVYSGGTRLIAEKVTSHDVITKLRWNKSSTALWFVADSGVSEDEQQLELVTMSAAASGLRARFSTLDIDDLVPIIDHGVMDITPDQKSLAFSNHLLGGRTELVALQDGEQPNHHAVQGSVASLQWIENDSLIYAVQQASEFSFWRADANGHVPIARFAGTLQASQADPAGKYISFIASIRNDALASYIVDTKTGVGKILATVPIFGGPTHLVQVKAAGGENVSTKITQSLEDAQLTAFIEAHIQEILPKENPTLERVIVTNEKNTVFVDYRTKDEKLSRILLLVQDAINPEWTVQATYQSSAGEWQKIQGAGVKDPTPVRLYEWEEDLKQWILKASY